MEMVKKRPYMTWKWHHIPMTYKVKSYILRNFYHIEYIDPYYGVYICDCLSAAKTLKSFIYQFHIVMKI